MSNLNIDHNTDLLKDVKLYDKLSDKHIDSCIKVCVDALDNEGDMCNLESVIDKISGLRSIDARFLEHKLSIEAVNEDMNAPSWLLYKLICVKTKRCLIEVIKKNFPHDGVSSVWKDYKPNQLFTMQCDKEVESYFISQDLRILNQLKLLLADITATGPKRLTIFKHVFGDRYNDSKTAINHFLDTHRNFRKSGIDIDISGVLHLVIVDSLRQSRVSIMGNDLSERLQVWIQSMGHDVEPVDAKTGFDFIIDGYIKVEAKRSLRERHRQTDQRVRKDMESGNNLFEYLLITNGDDLTENASLDIAEIGIDICVLDDVFKFRSGEFTNNNGVFPAKKLKSFLGT